jgi:carbonic anhydrase/acetyltransferase-like protein (isoleucine patch superfamily)
MGVDVSFFGNEAPVGVKCHVSRGDVQIGADVWVGSGATILSGVRIGHGAIIGARAVVTRDVPDYAIVGGNPAKVIRLRFEPDLIAALVETAWWELPREQVASLIPMLQAGDIPAFIAARKAIGSQASK